MGFGLNLRSLIPIVAVVLLYFPWSNKLPTHFGGSTTNEFKKVEEVFKNNFNNDREPDGASLAVFWKGVKVVDVWGGYADKESLRKWTENSISVTFSTTKAVAALCVSILVDQKRLKYDDLIVKHWPGFGKHKKDNITVQMALSHMSGLSWFDAEITEEMARDHNLMRMTIENETPKWSVGKDSGYHAYTFGWIVDQIIRHSDTKKRGIGQFFREEVSTKYNIDYHIGLPSSEEYRVARLSVPTMWQRVKEVWADFRVIKYFYTLWDLMQEGSYLHKIVSNPSWLETVTSCTVNNPDFHTLEQAAALGIGNARSLATLFDMFIHGKIVSEATLDTVSRWHINVTDMIFKDTVAKGHGFLYQPIHRAGTEFGVGHSGHGCQQLITDRKNELVISYVSNGLKTGLYNLCGTYYRLQTAVYDVIEGKQKIKNT